MRLTYKIMGGICPVTVLMPVYNAGKFLEEAINSILRQTFTNFEFLIIDDGSNDESINIIKSFNDKRIRLLVNENNCGVADTLNRGLHEARGRYIARMDADDIALPERLQVQFDFMEKNPEVVVCGAFAEVIDHNSMYLSIKRRPEHDDIINTALLFANCMTHPLAFYKRECAIMVGGYPRMSCSQDYPLWLKMRKQGLLANIPVILLKYRWHCENISQKNQYVQWENSADTSYNVLCEEAKIDLPHGEYKKFWLFWQHQLGSIYATDIKRLEPLWQMSSQLPHSIELLAKPWLNVALKLIEQGNIKAGLCLQKYIKRYWGFDSGWEAKIISLKHGIFNAENKT